MRKRPDWNTMQVFKEWCLSIVEEIFMFSSYQLNPSVWLNGISV